MVAFVAFSALFLILAGLVLARLPLRSALRPLLRGAR